MDELKDKNVTNKYKVLIVEDDPSNNNMLKQVLEEAYDVQQAFNGKQAIDQIGSNRPDVILLDLILPDIDGFTICKHLKSKRDTNIIPIIILSALSDFKNISDGIMVGANKYITKPFEIDELLNSIEEMILWKENILKNESDKNYEFVNFTMKSELKYLDELNQMISLFLNRTNFSETEIEEIKLGIYEIGVNAMEWGNQLNKALLVKVGYELTDEKLTIYIEDEGKGFSFKDYLNGKYRGISDQDNRLKEGKRLGGFGILIARKYFDSITYNDAGNVAILVKSFCDKNKN